MKSGSSQTRTHINAIHQLARARMRGYAAAVHNIVAFAPLHGSHRCVQTHTCTHAAACAPLRCLTSLRPHPSTKSEGLPRTATTPACRERERQRDVYMPYTYKYIYMYIHTYRIHIHPPHARRHNHAWAPTHGCIYKHICKNVTKNHHTKNQNSYKKVTRLMNQLTWPYVTTYNHLYNCHHKCNLSAR